MTLPLSEACERNKAPIWQELAHWIEGRACRVLEVGSGTGQHAMYFCTQDPSLQWQPSDRPEYLWILDRIHKEKQIPNFLAPRELDVNETWNLPDPAYDAVYTANTLHIMSWVEVEKFFSKLRDLIKAETGLLIIYGPFKYSGQFTSPSNAQFDAFLRSENPLRGIRDFEEILNLAKAQGLTLKSDIAMPANNQLLIFKRP